MGELYICNTPRDMQMNLFSMTTHMIFTNLLIQCLYIFAATMHSSTNTQFPRNT